jgi:hypothetical protein
MLKNSWGTRIIQKYSIKSADLTISCWISDKCPRKKLLEKNNFVEHLDYDIRKGFMHAKMFKIEKSNSPSNAPHMCQE